MRRFKEPEHCAFQKTHNAPEMEICMPKKAARILASDTAVATEELEAVISYLDEKLDSARKRNEPVPFLAYRNRVIFQTTLDLRMGRS